MSKFDFKKISKLPWWHWSVLFPPKIGRKENRRVFIENQKFVLVGIAKFKTRLVYDKGNPLNYSREVYHTAYLYENNFGKRKFEVETQDMKFMLEHGYYHNYILPWRRGIYTIKFISTEKMTNV